MNVAGRISNSAQVGTSRQSTIANAAEACRPSA
jgi:hypothetical protein